MIINKQLQNFSVTFFESEEEYINIYYIRLIVIPLRNQHDVLVLQKFSIKFRKLSPKIEVTLAIIMQMRTLIDNLEVVKIEK